MIIFPAIDLRRGQCVRLRQGDPNAETVFGDDPASMAVHWVALGAAWLHVVNLDGAIGDQAADAPNLRCLSEIRRAAAVPIQFGGGLRSLEDIEFVLSQGATRVVLGTVAVTDPSLVAAAIRRFGVERIVGGLDAREGRVATHGWRTDSGEPILAAAQRLGGLGVRRLVVTDIARDGMLTGVDVAAMTELARQTGVRVIASGGVFGLDDIRQLKAVESAGIEGVIVGQAIYTGALDLRQAIAVAA
jgi:phosphoribosylformimino-5-aminoimidazole carboxamide ribotide isomerase